MSSPVAAVRSAWEASAGEYGNTVGVGIDIVEVAAVEQLIAAGGPAFLDAAWTALEQDEAGGATERLAAKWAAKEAVMKALRCGIGETEPVDIQITTAPGGAPVAVLQGRPLVIASQLRVAEVQIALSHEGGWAAAIAVASVNESQETDLTPTAAAERQKGIR